MSIFRSSFTKEVQEQLKVRQEAIQNRTPNSIQYMNSRNSFIRMTSAVNVDGSAEKAKQYVLLGGTLIDNKSLRSGVGSGNEAYSTKTPSGVNNLRGIRLMPGITSIDVKSKSAYGSLREVIVNFQCWDISQLEDLEVLYMRPGYTVLIEWGWLPYLDNAGQLQSRVPQFYDILEKEETERTIIFKELFLKSKASSGNYDAMYGYVKNYQWSARSDGGYDCSTTIISTGEIIESLKVNYVKASLDTKNKALLNDQILVGVDKHIDKDNGFEKNYSKNILAGLWYETYKLINNTSIVLNSNKIFHDNYVKVNIPSTKSPNTNSNDSLSSDGKQIYITLGAVFDLLKYVVPEDLLTLSLNKNTYDDDGTELLCIAHPLQISVDPTVCLINSPIWTGDQFISTVESAANAVLDDTVNAAAQDAFNLLYKGYKGLGTDEPAFFAGLKKITDINVYNRVNELIANDGTYDNLEDAIGGEFSNTSEMDRYKEIKAYFDSVNIDMKLEFPDGQYAKFSLPPVDKTRLSTINLISKNSKQSISNLQFLKNLKSDYFYKDPYTEIGVIKNIYVNLNFLYKLALSSNLESQDKKEKNEISVYNYLKSLISAIQTSLGNINSFEIHVDPQDSIARIIDINYTEPKKATYDTLFELQVHNLKSIVRSYTLQSQIFPEQSAIIAIGSQAKGGQLGIQNNTMVDFNRSLIDRIIPTKATSKFNIGTNKEEVEQLNTILANLIQLFSSLANTPSVDKTPTSNNTVTYNDGKNALRDLIVYFQSLTSSPGKNRNLIPAKFSFEMDGIGGLVIGHMFKLPKNILPKGYRGVNNLGSQLGQTITSIGHTLNNNDWVTRIDALNIVLNDNTNLVPFEELDLKKILINSFNPTADNNYIPSALDQPNADNLKSNLETFKIATVEGNELKSGGEITQGIAGAAFAVLSVIKNKYPDINLTVTAGNDAFHQNNAGNSNHKVGRAIDFSISPNNKVNRDKVEAELKAYQQTIGGSPSPTFRYINEYDRPSKDSTGGHFHISWDVNTKGA
jgi:hypothetical protein